MADSERGGLLPEETLPTATDGVICSDNCGQMSTSGTLQERRWDNTVVGKQEPCVASTCTSLHSQGTDDSSSSNEHHDVGRTATVVVKEEPVESAPLWNVEDCCAGVSGGGSLLRESLERQWENGPLPVPEESPEEILPTLVDEGVCSKDFGVLSSSQMPLEGHWNNHVSVKREPEEEFVASPHLHSEPADMPSFSCVSPEEVQTDVVVKEEPEEEFVASTELHSEPSDMPSILRARLEQVQTDGVRVKEEPEEASAASTCGSWDPEDASTLSSQYEYPDEWRTDSVAIKQEPEEMQPSPAGSCSYAEECGDVSPSSLHPEARCSNGRSGKKGRQRGVLRARSSYTIEQKVKVVEWHHKNGNNVSKTAREFKVDRKRVREWITKYQFLLELSHGKAKLRRALSVGRPPLSKEVDNGLMDFLESQRSAGRSVSCRLLREHARQLAAKMGLGNFQASSQYLACWKKRFNVSLRVRKSERRELRKSERRELPAN